MIGQKNLNLDLVGDCYKVWRSWRNIPCFVTLIILNRTKSVFISLLRAEKRIDLSAMSSSQYNNETFERAAEMSDECQCYYFLSYYQQ